MPINFGIGELKGVWESPENGDIVLQISFHAMTFEDVALIFAALLPTWSLLVHLVFEALPEWWTSLGEKAARDETTLPHTPRRQLATPLHVHRAPRGAAYSHARHARRAA